MMRVEGKAVQGEAMSRDWRLDWVCPLRCIFIELIRAMTPVEVVVTNRAYDVIAQVEALLRKNELVNERQSAPKPTAINTMVDNNGLPNALLATYGTTSLSPPSRHCMSDDPQPQAHPDSAETSEGKKLDAALGDKFSSEIIELGLEEPLPSQQILEDLYEA
jgi:hypothetical protein